MSFGLFFKAVVNSVCVHTFFKLHKGEIDEFLRWPFKETVRLSIIHPSMQEKCLILEGAVVISAGFDSRPMSDSNEALCSEAHLCSEELERDGYVKDDQLLLKFEILT